MVHQMRSVALNLFLILNGTEDNLNEALGGKGAEANPSNWPRVFDQGESLVVAVENLLRYVLFWHPKN